MAVSDIADILSRHTEQITISSKDVLGLGSVRREHTDSKTLLIVKAGLH